MIKRTFTCRAICAFLLFLSSCGAKKLQNDFQKNHPTGFVLTRITEGFGAVDSAWDSIDSKGVNTRLHDAIDGAEDEFELSAYSFADLLGEPDAPLAELLHTDLANLVTLLTDPQTRHYEKIDVDSFYAASTDAEIHNFYAFLDKMFTSGVEVPDDYISGLVDKLVRYAIEAIPTDHANEPDKAWLNTKIDDLVEDLKDPDFRSDFIDLAKLASKLTLQTDYPMWVDSTGTPLDYADIHPAEHINLDLGNAVQGTHDLLVWLNTVIREPRTRVLVHDAIQSMTHVFDPSPQTDLAKKLRELVVNLEDHFTAGGEVYTSDATYSENSTTIYSDAELGQTIREMFPMLQQLFLRSDRPNAMIASESGQAPVYPLDLMVANLRGVGFDPDTIDVERSIYDLLRYDLWGRDRLTDVDAWPTPFLESMMFLTFVTSHHGWMDGGDTTEVARNTDPRDQHGHGTYVEDLTLNDVLGSIKTNKTLNLLGIYDITLKPTDGNHIYRSKTPFVLAEVDNLHTGTVTGDDLDYRFFFDQNYGVLQTLAGPGVGDLGTPDGGNPTGESLALNHYLAYAPNGLHETQLSAWTMGWVVRACFHGEGPYYFADPNAETVTMDGTVYRKYLRPDGKLYALVSTDGSQYVYPSEDGDIEDPNTAIISYNGKRQRDNRYKHQWSSDHYVVHYDVGLFSTNHFFTIDNTSGDTTIKEITGDQDNQAGSLTYHELVPETDPVRPCASPEEAFYRNYQWVMNEKKMVAILPLYMEILGVVKAVAFQVLECHGWSGLANLRKYRGNHVWAKKASAGDSSIPGDYRVEVVSASTPIVNAIIINDSSIYNDTLDCGNVTPSIVGQNLPALYRLAFPRSPEIDRGTGITDRVLGSRDFTVGDAIWNERNAFAPLLFSLMAGLRERTPAYASGQKPGIDAGMRPFVNQVALLIKPLFYFSKAGSDADPSSTWIPRVHSTELYGDFRGHPFLQSSAEFYSGAPDTWFGSWQEARHFQPAVKKTLLNVLIDSDLNDPQKRCDGLLPLVTETRTLSNLLKLLLDPSTPAPPLEQLVSAIKWTKGELTAINETAESGKGMAYPRWMFAQGVDATRDAFGAYTEYERVRNEDLILDDLLDAVVGHDTLDDAHVGYGLAHYPDDKPTDDDWQDFDDGVDTLADLLHESSPYSITPNVLHLVDRLLARDESYTSDEIRGLLYTTGKLFGYHDPNLDRWVYQGEDGYADIYNMLALRIPALHDVVTANEVLDPAAAGGPPEFYGYGDHYYAQLALLSNLVGSDGLVEFLLNTITVPENSEVVLSDVDRFLSSRHFADPESELWPTLAELLRDLGHAVAKAKGGDLVDEIVMDYGFQIN